MQEGFDFSSAQIFFALIPALALHLSQFFYLPSVWSNGPDSMSDQCSAAIANRVAAFQCKQNAALANLKLPHQFSVTKVSESEAGPGLLSLQSRAASADESSRHCHINHLLEKRGAVFAKWGCPAFAVLQRRAAFVRLWRQTFHSLINPLLFQTELCTFWGPSCCTSCISSVTLFSLCQLCSSRCCSAFLSILSISFVSLLRFPRSYMHLNDLYVKERVQCCLFNSQPVPGLHNFFKWSIIKVV